MRRKPKTEVSNEKNVNRQRSFSNAGSFVESLHSINTHSTEDQSHEATVSKSNSAHNFVDINTSPSSPTSLEPPSLKKAPSITGSLASAVSSQPAVCIFLCLFYFIFN